MEVGGELRAAGRKRDGSAWRVAIEQPDVIGRAIHLAVDLKDRAMATSGDYRNFYEENGVRISHTIDPRTGRPISHALASVTVIDETAMRADALATALNVLGPKRAMLWRSEELELAAYFIVRARTATSRRARRRSFDALLD